MAPLVSVIIPTYNRWPMVREAVDSALAQSCPAIELLVVDDGSEDSTASELRSRYGSSVRVLSQPRQGVAAARNLGVRRSTGDYLAFLDSDDLWLPQKIERQIAFMGARPQAQICQTEEIWVRRGRQVNPRLRHRKPSGDIFRASLGLCLVSPSAVMMKRELFERVGGFDESFTVCEDYDLWLRIALDTFVYLIPDALVVKRGGHGDQLSRSTWGLDRFRVRAIKKLLDGGLVGERRRWAIEELARKVAILARGARARGRESEALYFESILLEFKEEICDNGSACSCLRQRERIPQAHP